MSILGDGGAHLFKYDNPNSHNFKPAVAAVEALRDSRRWLGRAAKAFHRFSPEKTLSGFACRFFRLLTCMYGADLCASYSVAKNPPSGWSAHSGYCGGPCGCGQCRYQYRCPERPDPLIGPKKCATSMCLRIGHFHFDRPVAFPMANPANVRGRQVVYLNPLRIRA
jgi:hypothetical protein